MYSKANDVMALVYLNVMNIKFAFIVVQKYPPCLGESHRNHPLLQSNRNDQVANPQLAVVS